MHALEREYAMKAADVKKLQESFRFEEQRIAKLRKIIGPGSEAFSKEKLDLGDQLQAIIAHRENTQQQLKQMGRCSDSQNTRPFV